MPYIVKNSAGDIIASDTDAVEAAMAIMADDARGAEIRDFYYVDGVMSDGLDAASERAAEAKADTMAEAPIDEDDAADMLERAAAIEPVFEAWHMCRQAMHDKWPRRTAYWSIEPDYAAAALDIALKILDDAPGWRQPYHVEVR